MDVDVSRANNKQNALDLPDRGMLLGHKMRLIEVDNGIDGRRGLLDRPCCGEGTKSANCQKLPSGTILGMKVGWYLGRYIDLRAIMT